MDTPRIWQYIMDNFLDFLSTIRLRQVSKLHYGLKIYDFLNIPKEYINKLTNEIIKKYPFIQKLDANNNPKITNVSYLTNLEILWASGNRGIDNNGLTDCINIKELNANDNPKITNVSHMTKLEILWAYDDCGIDDNGLMGCINIKELEASNNPKITNVSHMTKLEILWADDDCGIDDNGLIGCINIK